MTAQQMQNHVRGAILGFAVGDALGVPAEFQSREALRAQPMTEMIAGGAHGQPVGTWSDDTSMTLCALDSLLHCGVDYEDLMDRFADWAGNAAYTATDEVFDMGITCRRAILSHARGCAALDCGQTDEYACGNGSLMRILPIALWLLGADGNAQLDDHTATFIHNDSRCTHAHPRCLMACGIYCAVLFEMTRQQDLQGAVSAGIEKALAYYKTQPDFEGVYGDFADLPQIGHLPEEQIRGSGFVLHALHASLWCLLTTDTYADCVRKAIALGEDTDTTAAIAGGLAGLWYGEENIPLRWRQVLRKWDMLTDLCDRFADAARME